MDFSRDLEGVVGVARNPGEHRESLRARVSASGHSWPRAGSVHRLKWQHTLELSECGADGRLTGVAATDDGPWPVVSIVFLLLELEHVMWSRPAEEGRCAAGDGLQFCPLRLVVTYRVE